MNDFTNIKSEALKAIENSPSLDALEKLRIHYLGKSGVIPQKMQGIGALSIEERKNFGASLNALKNEITTQLDQKKHALDAAHLNAKLATETADITLPIRPEPTGALHPISQVIDEATALLGAMGFVVAKGPEIEDDYHNFTALNIPADHPARQMHDTFYFPPISSPPAGGGRQEGGKERFLLRTHTSPVQIRVMEHGVPPFRIMVPGRTYRCDSDMTHSPMFHQIEGLYIDKNIHMGHLKGCLIQFVQQFFELQDLPVRFRPSFFPFTEPSAEMDIGCSREGGELKIGKGKDWLEILGCGMVHPNVLKNVGLNPEEWQGFAFGMGIERLAMLKYGITDLRTFFEGDIRGLNHYGFAPLDIPTLTGGLSQ